MERIAIVGLGLIGTSIGLGLQRQKRKDVEIIGHDREPVVAGRARQRGAVDRISWSLPNTVEGAKLVIIATPVQAVREVLEHIAPVLSEGAVVTDTASTKVEVLKWAEEILPPHVHFVGGHPLAGKEVSGPDAADANLLDGALYCLVPSRRAPASAVQSMMAVVNALGATPYFLDAHEHDGLVAGVSHLPLVLSAAMVTATSQSPAWREMAKVAATGYRDITRLASGSPEMGRDILLTNREEVVRWIDRFIETLLSYRRMVLEGDEMLETALTQAREARERWLRGETEPEGPQVPLPSASDMMSDLFLGGIGRRMLGRRDELAERLEELRRERRHRRERS